MKTKEEIEEKIRRLEKENKQLKEEVETWKYQTQQSDRLADEDFKKVCKYQTCLQEIKGIVTALYMNEWLQRNETAKQSIQLLQDKISEV